MQIPAEPFQFFHSTPNGDPSTIDFSFRDYYSDLQHMGNITEPAGLTVAYVGNNIKPETCDDFEMPSLPDDDDDFSWLVKVLPGNDQTVPSAQPEVSQPQPPPQPEQGEIAQQNTMLFNSYFSEMDVSQIFLPEGDQITIKIEQVHDAPEPLPENKQVDPPVRRQKRKSSVIDNCQETDTPVSLRRSQRKKRSCKEMIEAEAALCKPPEKANRSTSKRRRVESGRRSASKARLSPALVTEAVSGARKRKSPSPIQKVIKRERSELTLVFKKYRPVNPLEKKITGYARGLLDSSKTLAGELYMTQFVPSAARPDFEDSLGIDNSLVAFNSVKPDKVKVLMKKEWMTIQNAIANVKAHGTEVLGNKSLTEDGKALRGAFHTINLDGEYENLLKAQNNCETVLKWKSLYCKRQKADISSTNVSFGPDKTFSNFSNFTSYFHETSEDHRETVVDRNQGMVGVVPVNPFATLSSDVAKNWTVFGFKGKLYRPNPVTVTIRRTPDDVIKEMKAKPKRISLDAPYYKALTTYFDKNSKPI